MPTVAGAVMATMVVALIVLFALTAPLVLKLIAAGSVALIWMMRRGQHNTSWRAPGKAGGAETVTELEALKAEYPWRRLFTSEAQVDAAFAAIRAFKPRFVRVPYKINNMPGVTDLSFDCPQTGLGRGPTLIALRPADYHTMNWISDWFNERRRLACRRHDEPMSPIEYWTENRAQVIGHCQSGGALTWERLNDEMYSRVIGCNNFRPGLMRGFIELFGAASVLDFSSGWGDRLIGFLASGATRYVGVDPNPGVHEGYTEIIARFGRPTARVTMIVAPFQTANIDETFDLVFTSPPYFDLELYGDGADQSVVQYAALDGWFEGFLMTSLHKAWGALNPGGHMVIIINNARDRPDYVMRMVAAVSAWSGATYMGVVSYADEVSSRGPPRYKSPQPMWCWRKNGGVVSTVTIEPLAARHADELAVISKDPEVMRTIANGRPWPRDRIMSLIEWSAVDDGPQRAYYHWVIMNNGHVIGYVGLYPLEANAQDGTPPLQVRIFLARSAQGRGYGRAALGAAIEAYKATGGTVVYMQMAPANVASVRLAAALGFEEVPGDWSINGVPVRRFALEM